MSQNSIRYFIYNWGVEKKTKLLYKYMRQNLLHILNGVKNIPL